MARRPNNKRLLVRVLVMGCLGGCFPAAHAETTQTPPHTTILGQYVAYPVHELATRVTRPACSGCKILVKNLNQFRDVPFGSNNPRLSPRYPQFQRPHWTPIPWNRALAKAAETRCPGGICTPYNASDRPAIWANWLRQTKASRRAHQPLLWRTTVDLLGNGEHETLICLRASSLGYVSGTPTSAPLPSSPPCPFTDSRLYMLPSPHPRMAHAFDRENMGEVWSRSIFGPTDIIRNTLDKKYRYYILGWQESRPQTILSRPQYGIRGVIGVTALMKNAPGDKRPYQHVALANIAWVPPVHVLTSTGHPWPRVLYQGNKLSFACAQALPLAQSQFDSDHFYLYGPPPVPPGSASALVLGPKPGDISGGDGIAYDRKVFRKMNGPVRSGPNRIAFWQKQASSGRRLVVTDEYFNWQGDQYALLSISPDITPARFWAEFPGYNRVAGPPVPGMTTIVPYTWRPPLVLSDKTNGRLWAVDVGGPYIFLRRWKIHPLDTSAVLSPCIVRFHPRVTNAALLLPAPVRALAGLLDRALGPGENEGTLHPTAALRNAAQATWANVAMRPWALTREPYDTRAQVDANLRLWAKDAPLFQAIYDDIQRQYPLAKRALARYYRVRFRKSAKEANALAARALDIAFRSYFDFPSNDAGD